MVGRHELTAEASQTASWPGHGHRQQQQAVCLARLVSMLPRCRALPAPTARAATPAGPGSSAPAHLAPPLALLCQLMAAN